MNEPKTHQEVENEPSAGRSDREHLTDSPRNTPAAATNGDSSARDTASSEGRTAASERTNEVSGSAPAPSAASASGGSGRLWRALRRFFWMDDRLAAASKEPFGPGCRGWDEFDLGSAAARGADRLVESGELETSRLLLYRSAAALLAHAHLMRAGFVPSEPPATGERREPSADSLDDLAPDTSRGSDSAKAKGGGPRLGDPGSAFELGCEAVRASERLRESGGPQHSALLLLRTAAVLFVDAYQSVPEGGLRPPALSDQDWDRLARLPDAAQAIADLSPDGRHLVTACLGPGGESHIATLSRKERRVALRLLGRLTRELAVPLSSKARGATRVILSRWLRIGTTAAVLAALIAYGLSMSGLFDDQNLALHRPVTMSSVFSADTGRDPSLLVDGDTSNLGFHTAHGVQQHVTIDLGTAQRIRRVVVYNRSDCCQERAVPLHVEVSQDGNAYQRVATRTETFSEWEAEFPPVTARYVRLLRPKKDYFHLAEVEVY